jgi:hypothetical protein
MAVDDNGAHDMHNDLSKESKNNDESEENDSKNVKNGDVYEGEYKNGYVPILNIYCCSENDQINIEAFVYTCKCTCIHKYIHIYLYIYVYMYVYMYFFRNMCLCMYIGIYL